MSRVGRKSSGIPDRWLDYKAVGRRLVGTRFIAFKVPLKQSLTRRLPLSDVFGPWELLDALSHDRQELGLIIDLTFTSRYYNLQDVPESLLCVKILTAGHEVPSDATILSFKRAVRRFLRGNADNDQLIGVHCTHGLNRTGYLICRYLIDVDGMEPQDAVDLFNSSRGHDIERQNYIDDLTRGPKRSNAGIEESEQEPRRGGAARRHHSSVESREEPRGHCADSWYHRSFPPGESNHRSHHYPPPSPSYPPPIRPPPPSRPPSSHSDTHWRRAPRTGDARHEQEWSPAPWHQEDWRRRPLPPPLPRYTPRWTNESHVYDRDEEAWTSHDHRHARRVNRFDHN